MSSFLPRRAGMFLVRRWLLALLAAVALGCAAETPPEPAAGKYRPADEGEAPAVADASPAVPDQPGTTLPSATADSPATSPLPSSTAGSDAPPASAGNLATGPYPLPTGGTSELVAFINKLGQQQPQGQTRGELIADFQDMQNARLAAADKVLASKPTPELKLQMIQAKLSVFLELQRLDVPGASARLKDFALGLTKQPEPDIAQFGRYLLFDINTAELVREGDGKEVVAQVKAILESERGSQQVYSLAVQASQALATGGLKDESAAALRLIADELKQEKDPQLSSQAPTIEAQARIIEADVSNLAVDVLTNKPDAEAKLLESVQGLLKEQPTNVAYFEPIREAAQTMEFTGQTEVAGKLYDALAEAFKDHENQQLVGAAMEMIGRARKRLSLVGKPFSVEGFKLDGSPFDWKDYAGKVVLVDFWATWCGPCLEELPNIQKNYAAFKDQGFEVVGVNLDQELATVKDFLSVQPLPWTSVVSQAVLDGKASENWSELPMAAKFGVDAIPFIVLVGKDGKVDSLHVRGPKLQTRLTKLLGEPGEKPGAGPPPAANNAAPAQDKPGQSKPETSEEPAAASCDETPAAASDEPNPYSAKPGLTNAQLVTFIEKMVDKPLSIQGRPGFGAALVEACDRILAADPAVKDVEFYIAAETKLSQLHKQACAGDDAADQQLGEFVATLKADKRPRLARQVAFFEQERKVLDGAELPADKITTLLKELRDYYAAEKLESRHLRMASSTVALINKLEDGDIREKHFAEFGGLFAKSSDKELARYGKKLAQKPATEESDLVGKPLELAGPTVKGLPLNWQAYRGKVVLVDFWATWCGPCRKAMPLVKELYEKHREQGFDVVGISLDKDQEALAQYLEENAIAWETVAGDEAHGLAEKYGVRGIPTLMLVDRTGKVLGVGHSLAALVPLLEKELK